MAILDWMAAERAGGKQMTYEYLNPAKGGWRLATFRDPSGMQAIGGIGPIEEPFGPLPAPPGGFQIGPGPITVGGLPPGFQLPPVLAPGPLSPIRAQPAPSPGHGLPPIVGQPTPGPILVIPGPQPTPGPAPITPGPQPIQVIPPGPIGPAPQPFQAPAPLPTPVPQPGPGPSGGGGFFNPQPFRVPVPIQVQPGPAPQGGGGFQPGPQPGPQPLRTGQMLTINADPPAALDPSFASVDPRFQMERMSTHVCPNCGGELEDQTVQIADDLPIGAVIQDGRIVPPCSTCPG